MDDRKTFDLLTNPLEGINLIEASAGTGKTFTIAGLFLRLILEKNLLVNEILVVTFTKAATAELNDRIRNLLKEAIEGFARGQSDDEFLNGLIKQYPDPLPSLKRLKEALRDFDEAAIFTIHGFCQRVLKEHAFESSLLFDTELITDEEALKQEIIDDFWRINFYNASPLFIHYALNNHCTPENLLKLVRTYSDKPLLKVIPQVTIPDTSQEEKNFNDAFNKARDSWQSSKADVEKILANQIGFKQSVVSKVPELIIGFDYFLNAGNKNFTLFHQFDLFTVSGVKKATKKNYEPPQHPFFDFCEILKEKLQALSGVYEQRLLGLKTSLFTFLHQSLGKQKQRRNVQSFYDLLSKLRNALADKSGAELAKIIRAKYHAALIDEFQDTDPLQYEIFHNIFKNQGGILFLIGDPKQAIYSFRGADIFAYLLAISQVEKKYTLKENWRSDPQLINAVNTIFSHVKNPFVFEGIKFQEASAAKIKKLSRLSLPHS
jgi:ATP-dependent exoDNAse (exonuclease V) beta subunit (contains helicase and exonuclease domains)